MAGSANTGDRDEDPNRKPNPNPPQVAEKLQATGQIKYIDRTVIAHEADPQSEGMVLPGTGGRATPPLQPADVNEQVICHTCFNSNSRRVASPGPPQR